MSTDNLTVHECSIVAAVSDTLVALTKALAQAERAGLVIDFRLDNSAVAMFRVRKLHEHVWPLPGSKAAEAEH